MKKFVIFTETAEVKTNRTVENCTDNDLICFYFNEVDTCAKAVSIHNSIEEANEALNALNLKQTWAISLNRAQINIAYIQEVDIDDDLTYADFGDIYAAKIGERSGC